MLAPLYDELESATMVAQMSREALNRIHEKMMAQQKGEAFYDIGPPGSLEIPKFLQRHKDDPPSTMPMPKWITDARSPTKQTWGGRRIEGPLLMLNEKKGAAQELKEMAAKEREDAAAKARAKRDKRLGKQPVVAAEAPTGVWDVAAGRWRSEGTHMSAARYQRLLGEMPTEKHRKAFVEAYGHTQQPGKRDTVATPRKAEAAAPKATKPAAKPKDTTPARERKLNPEHDAKVSAMLTRPEGATLAEIGAAMGWQEHSASAFLTGIRKTRTIVKTAEARGNVYRLEQSK